MYTSLGGPPWLVVGAPMPTPGNTITASTATTLTPTDKRIRALLRSPTNIDLSPLHA
jgi:hypothetical protein